MLLYKLNCESAGISAEENMIICELCPLEPHFIRLHEVQKPSHVCGAALIPHGSVRRLTKTRISVVSSVLFPCKVKSVAGRRGTPRLTALHNTSAEIILPTENCCLSASHFSHFPQNGTRNTMNTNPLLSCLQLQLSISLLHILPF